MNGLSTAINEITLVLFTTLAPSGACAYVLMNLPVLFGNISEDIRHRLNRFSCLPLVIAMIGLIASATHLGNPANALYVFTGIGRSPLSTEVFCAVIFLALAGIYWLYSFAEVPRLKLQYALVVITDISAVLFIIATAYAYNVSTIPTWSLPLAPASLLLNALVGGPVVALFCFTAAARANNSFLTRGSVSKENSVTSRKKHAFSSKPSLIKPLHRKALLGLSTVALVVNILVYALIGMQLSSISNELISATELVPYYPLFVIAFAALATSGIIASFWFEKATKRIPPLVSQGIAAALVLTAIFLMRFSFYMSHLTIGLGV